MKDLCAHGFGQQGGEVFVGELVGFDYDLVQTDDGGKGLS